jgi:hypothetical protein
MTKMVRRWMRLGRLPPATAVQLIPVVLAIFNFTCILKRLCEQVAKEIIVGRIFEAKVANVAKVLVEFLCKDISM